MRFSASTLCVIGSLISTASATAINLTPRSGTPLTQAQAEARLVPAGITAYSTGGCTDKTNSHCTSYNGILSGTVDGVITLKNACKCDIVITGGTETGHASGTMSHANGYKVDVRKNAGSGQIDSYVTNTFTYIGLRSDGYKQWRSNAGNLYCDEGSHWDITYL